MPKSTVSRRVSELEARLGVAVAPAHDAQAEPDRRRPDRTTTTARASSGEIEEAERAVSSLQERPRGRLRVTTPANFGFLAPIVTDFLRRYPEVSIELVSTTRRWISSRSDSTWRFAPARSRTRR